MRFAGFMLAAMVWATGAAPAADLTRIDRTIKKEPAYQGKPKYCLLVFGPEAKTRVWLVQDGDVLYVDRNANGDLTEKDKRVALKKEGRSEDYRQFDAGDIHDGNLKHTGLSVSLFRMTQESVVNPQEWKRISSQEGGAWNWWVRVEAERAVEAGEKSELPKRIKYVANGDGLGYLLFADRPQDAPVVHFNGPWTLGLQDIKQRLTAGRKTMLQIGVGTPGVGPGTFSFVNYPDLIPPDAYPVAEITAPAKEAGQPPLQMKFTLTKRC